MDSSAVNQSYFIIAVLAVSMGYTGIFASISIEIIIIHSFEDKLKWDYIIPHI